MIQTNRILKDFLSLTSIDSPTGSEREAVDYCIDTLTKLGFTVEEDNAGNALHGNAGNLYAYLNGIGEPLLFTCHTDTVPPCTNKQVIIDPDGRIHAGGDTILGADDAAGIAELFEAIRSILEDGVEHRPIELVLTVSEEQRLLGAKQFDFSKVKAQEGYTLDIDGPVGIAVIAAPRSYRFHATIHGRSAHAALSPELGINAIVIASAAISTLPWGRLDDDTTSNIGVIRTDGAPNIVPDRCHLECEVRSLDPDKADARMDLMEKTFTEVCRRMGGELELDAFRSYDAYHVNPSEPVVQRFCSACKELGIQPNLTRSCGGSDNSVFTGKGLKGIVIAPGMHEIHGVNEHTSIQELTTMAKLVAKLMSSEN